jgi:four helix bundle protein
MNGKKTAKMLKKITLRVINLVEGLPDSLVADSVGKELLSLVQAIYFNYQKAQQARLQSDTINFLIVMEGKVEQTLVWLDLLLLSGFIKKAKLQRLVAEIRLLSQQLMTKSNLMRGGFKIPLNPP